MEELQGLNKETVVSMLRRGSCGFSRGASKYRGVTKHHQQGRWEARIGRVASSRYVVSERVLACLAWCIHLLEAAWWNVSCAWSSVLHLIVCFSVLTCPATAFCVHSAPALLPVQQVGLSMSLMHLTAHKPPRL